MKVGLAPRRVVRCIAILSMLSSFCSAALASDAQTYQTAASRVDADNALNMNRWQ